MQARCRATPSYSEIEGTGRKQRKRCLYLNWRKQIQLDYINLPSEMQRRKRHYSFPLLPKFHLLWGLNIINVSLNERIRTTKDATHYPSEVAYYLRYAMFYVTLQCTWNSLRVVHTFT